MAQNVFQNPDITGGTGAVPFSHEPVPPEQVPVPEEQVSTICRTGLEPGPMALCKSDNVPALLLSRGFVVQYLAALGTTLAGPYTFE